MTYSKITAARTLNIKLLRSGLFLSQARLTLQPVSPSPARLNPGLSLCDGHRHLSLQNTQSESQRQPLSICTACLVLSLTLTLMTLQYFYFFPGLQQRETGQIVHRYNLKWHTTQCISLILTVPEEAD